MQYDLCNSCKMVVAVAVIVLGWISYQNVLKKYLFYLKATVHNV